MGMPDDGQAEPAMFAIPATRAISWEKPFTENGKTVVPGSVQADFGRFEFRWLLAPDGSTRLVTIEPGGSAEVPSLEKQLWPLVLDTGVTALFLEWLPLLNDKSPIRLRMIVVVSTKELFVELPTLLIPGASNLRRAFDTVSWDGLSEENGTQFLRGAIRSSDGTHDVFWKREPRGQPVLREKAQKPVGHLSTGEIRLVPWIDDEARAAMICREIGIEDDKSQTPHLVPLAMVQKEELLSGYRGLP